MESLLFGLLRHAVCGEELKEETKRACTPENLEAIYALARKHDLAHLVAHALEGQTIPDCEAMKKLRTAKMKAIYRYARMDLAYEQICKTLEDAQIAFIPLKGSVLRQYYPEPWMRTSGDIDILVKEVEFERARKALETAGWITKGNIQYQNICMYSPNGILLELHFNIRVKLDTADAVMDTVWQNCKQMSGRQFGYLQTNEFFFCHQLAHMAKHVLVGGSGIRTFLDIWLLNKNLPMNDEELQKLCRASQLDVFYRKVLELTGVWFGQAVHTQITEKFEQYILSGGVYGTLSNKVLMAQAQKGGKIKNFLNRMFVPYEEMKLMYPILKRRKWLLPVYQLVRWCQVIADGRMKKAISELKINQSYSDVQVEDAKHFMENIGLQHAKNVKFDDTYI